MLSHGLNQWLSTWREGRANQGSSGACNASEWLEGVESGSTPSQSLFKGWQWRQGYSSRDPCLPEDHVGFLKVSSCLFEIILFLCLLLLHQRRFSLMWHEALLLCCLVLFIVFQLPDRCEHHPKWRLQKWSFTHIVIVMKFMFQLHYARGPSSRCIHFSIKYELGHFSKILCSSLSSSTKKQNDKFIGTTFLLLKLLYF